MIQIPKKIIIRNNSDTSLRGRKTIYNKIRSYMTTREINSNLILSSALTQDKRITLKLLTPSKAKIISIKGIKNEKNQRFVNQLNTFGKVYSNYYKNQKYSMDEINNLSKENSLFIKNYHELEKKIDLKDNKKFEEIKKEYEKKNYNLPTIDGNKNLFGGSLLLSNSETDLKKYIIYGVGSQRSNDKSIKYLNKINEDINKKTKKGKKIRSPFKLLQSFRRGDEEAQSPFYAHYKILNKKLKEIMDYQKDIYNIKNTIESIPEIDYFFDVDNKRYLNSLKFLDSRKSSANFSTGVNLERINGNINSSFCSRKDFNASNISSIPDETRVTYSKDLKGKISRVGFNLNTMVSFLEKQKNKGNDKSQNEIPTFTHIIKKPKKEIKIPVVKIYKNDQKKSLENLYNEVSKSYNTIILNKKIEKYLKLRKYEILPKIAPSNLCHNIENVREKICKGRTLKKVIELRKNLEDSRIAVDKVNRKELSAAKNMNEMEDKMIKVFSGFNSC